MKINNSEFPILWINDIDSSLGVFKDLDELMTCTSGTLRSGWYTELKLITHSGKILGINRARKVQTKSQFSVSTLFWKIFGAELIKVELDLVELSYKLNLDDLRKNIRCILIRNIDRWDSDGNLDQLLSLLEKATSVSEVVDLMKRRYFKEPLI